MRLEIHLHDLSLDAEQHAHVERRLAFALGRFGPRVRRLDLHLTDVNGPRGGVDKQCRALVRLTPAGQLTLADHDHDVATLVDRVADRLARAVGREFERRREHRHALPRYAV